MIHLPHISNATDFVPLTQTSDVAVHTIDSPASFGSPDVVILPGTKSTIADYEWLQRQGLADCVREHAKRGGWLIGVCGGYQMLGREVRDEEGIESSRRVMEGLGLLPVVTHFEARKQLAQVEAVCLLPGLEGAKVRGYEIHQGRTTAENGAPPAFKIVRLFDEPASQSDGASASLSLFGTYLHGLFDHASFRRAYLNRLREHKGLTPLPPHAYDTTRKNFDQLADWLQDHLDMRRVKEIVGLPI